MQKSFWLAILMAGAEVFGFGAIAAPKPAPNSKPESPFVLYPACPCYLLSGEGSGETKINAVINAPETSRFGWRLEVKLTRVNGPVIQTVTSDASKATTSEVILHIPLLAGAVYNVHARLLNSAGRESAVADTDVHVVKQETSRVTLGADGYFRCAGKPDFVIGMYNSGRYPEMAAAGFDAVHNYGITVGDAIAQINPSDCRLKQLLDNASSNGMRMMVELPRKAIEQGQWQQVSRRIETFKHHPGMLCWGSEERVARGLTSLTNIETLYHLVHQFDPDHPLVLGDSKVKVPKRQTDRRDFFPDHCMDVGIWWWYPIPLNDPDGNGLLQGQAKVEPMLTPPSWLTTTISKKPLWIAIQSYQHPTQEGRFPTPAEYRCMAYLSIINGVKGLWFYTGSGQRDFEGKPAGLFNKPEDGRWVYVQELARELRNFSPVIMSPLASDKVAMNPANAPVEFTTRDQQGKKYLIAANKSSLPQSVTFSSEIFKGKHPKILFENEQKPETNNGACTASFEPLGVHVIRID